MKKIDNHKNNNDKKLPDELDKISKKNLLVERMENISNMHYITQNDCLNSLFKDRVLKLIDEVKLNEIKRKIDNDYSNEQNNEKKKVTINNIISEYNEIKKENMKEYEFYDKLLVQLMCDYSKKSKESEESKEFEDVKKIFNEVCGSIIHTRIEILIKKEKKIINMKEILNEIKF